MKQLIPLVGALLLTGICGAQDKNPAQTQDPKARLASLKQEHTDTIKTFRSESRKRYAEAKKRAEEAKANAKAEGGTTKSSSPMPAMRMRPDLSGLAVKFAAAANDYAGTEDAVPFLLWSIQNSGDKKASKAAVSTVTASHAASPQLSSMARMFAYLPRMVGEESATALMSAIKEQNKDPNVLGWIALSNLGPTIDTGKKDSNAYTSARASLMASANSASDKVLKKQILARIQLREKLGTGNVAPDIAGIDIDGVAFKLSDYKGKIIFLDFWGDW